MENTDDWWSWASPASYFDGAMLEPLGRWFSDNRPTKRLAEWAKWALSSDLTDWLSNTEFVQWVLGIKWVRRALDAARWALGTTALVSVNLPWVLGRFFYTFPHHTAGPMLATTLPGPSAAATGGILEGTAGWIGLAGSMILNPTVQAVSLVVGPAILALELAGWVSDYFLED